MPVTGGINWAEIAGSFGVGAILSAVVTTYGGKGRERRRARSKALARLMKIEVTRRTLPLAEGTYYDMATFARLASACMIAGVPRPVVILYDEICEVSRRFTVRDDADSWHVDMLPMEASDMLAVEASDMLAVEASDMLAVEASDMLAVEASVALADDAAHLLRDTLWRPALTFPRRWWRTWRLRRKALRLYGHHWPSSLTQSGYREWLYREWLRADKAERKAERRAWRGATDPAVPAASTEPAELS